MGDLIATWRAARARWAAGNAGKLPVKAQNELMDEIRALSREIASHQEIHPLIEGLCAPEHDPDDRLGAALVREHWDPEGAASTLVAIVEDSGQSIQRPVDMSAALAIRTTSTARTAALCLLNIDSGRGNTGR
jgi:hypothetical protein